MRNNKLVQINEGQHYLFFNFFEGQNKVTLGFPYIDSFRNDVYLAINGKEKGRITFYQAQKHLTDSFKSIIVQKKIKGITFKSEFKIQKNNHRLSKCKSCDKNLRGNLEKALCTECYNNFGRPELINTEKFKQLNKTFIQTFELICTNHKIYDIALFRELKFDTIIKHIEKLSEFIDLYQFSNLWPDINKLNRVRFSLNNLPEDFTLKMLFEQINSENKDEMSYSDIRHCLLFKDL